MQCILRLLHQQWNGSVFIVCIVWFCCPSAHPPTHPPTSPGDYAVVTGGSEGIGLGIASSLAVRGVNLVLVSRSDEKLSRAAAHLRGKFPGVAVVTVAVDLTKDGAAQKVCWAAGDWGFGWVGRW